MFKELNNLNKTNMNVLRIFFESPTQEFNVREMARILKIAPATASSQLKSFAKSEILKERKERNLILYKADLDSEIYLDLKVFYNIRKIKTSGLLEELNKFYLKPTLILFGSASEGAVEETWSTEGNRNIWIDDWFDTRWEVPELKAAVWFNDGKMSCYEWDNLDSSNKSEFRNEVNNVYWKQTP